MISKVYVVSEYGGMYEDSWEHIVGVFSTSELADKAKFQIEENHNPSNLVISEKEWESMTDQLYDQEPECDDTIKGIKELFPKYSEKDIEKASILYDGYLDWVGVIIREINFYTELSDISNNGLNCW